MVRLFQTAIAIYIFFVFQILKSRCIPNDCNKHETLRQWNTLIRGLFNKVSDPLKV